MARYIGPKSKIARKFKEPIFGSDKSLEKKNYPPGQHGPNRRRKKESEYSIQLTEKQKAKYTYGILEKQFSNLFKEASRVKGITGENLLRLCESRLDNVIYRMGLAASRSAARQMVGHKHFLVNDKLVNIPSFQLKSGDVIEVRERSKSMEAITEALANRNNSFDWLEVDTQNKKGIYVNIPERAQIPENIKEQLIVELYSK